MFRSQLLINFIYLSLLKEHCQALQEIYPYITPKDCSTTQYFDSESFKCLPCDVGFTKSSDGMSCVCTGSNKYIGNVNSKKQCLQCKLTEYISADRSSCVSKNCFNNTNGKTTCTLCKKDQIIITHAPNGSILSTVECVSCAPGYTPSSDKSHCQPCSKLIGKTNDPLCECDQKQFKSIDNICIPNQFIKNVSIYQPKTESGEAIESVFIEKHWAISNYLCSQKNMSACQIAGNICVLSLYSNKIDSPCKLWRNTKSQVKPSIMYEDDEAFAVLFRKKIPIVYSLSTHSEYNYVDLVATSFNEYGKINNFLDTKPTWLLPCPSIQNVAIKDIFKFGINHRYKCKINIQQLISQSNTQFYEVYVKFTDKDNKALTPQLHGAPVLIKSDLINFNKENDINSWQLVKRFFLFDKISGVSISNGRETLKYFRYANFMGMKIRVRRKGKGERSKIYPPLLTIHYEELSEHNIKENSDISLEFNLEYELEDSSMVNGMEISVGSLSAFAVLYSILQSWSYSRRSGKLGVDTQAIIKFFIFLCGNLANTFYIVAFGASIYSFLIYKTQKVIYTAVPSDKDEYTIQSYIIVAFSLKMVEVIALNWEQINVDLFFIDWEKPMLPASDLNAKISRVKTELQISFWRPYFVANEWNEIQTLRKTSLPLQIISCILIIEIFGAASWTHIGIDASPEHPSKHLISPTHQLALSGLVFITVYFIQLTLSIFVYERYIKNAILDFMDICSIANVSMLIFDKFLHGYYLHGRCVYASCNTDVRGLQPGLPYRAFEVRCTTEFRLYFSRLSFHFISKNLKWQWQHHIAAGGAENGNANMFAESTQRPSSKSSRQDTESIASVMTSSLPSALEHKAQAVNLTNKFLTAFFDHGLEDLDYEVRETRYIERLLDVEFIDEGNYKTLLLYNSIGNSQPFQKAIWYGHEWTLTTFDLFLFCFVQMLSQNYVLSGLITLIAWKMFSICRKYGGKKNIAKKTLVDERFLV